MMDNDSLLTTAPTALASRLFLGVLGVIVALAMSELAFMTVISPPRLFFGPANASSLSYDSFAGWVPIADNVGYSDEGILLPKSHLRNGRQRIVFLGDSVTAAGRVTDAFDRMSGGSVEILNAGVPGYETSQEVRLFEDRVVRTSPAIVVLLFHPNDFDVGVSAVRDANGSIRVVNSLGDALRANSWLFRRSVTYQFVLQSAVRMQAWRFSRAEVIENSLARLARLSREHDFELYVVLLPWFKSPDTWSDLENSNRTIISKIVTGLGLCAFDGYEALTASVGRLHSIQDMPGDEHHPNQAFADLLTERFFERGFRRTSDPSRPLKLACPPADSPFVASFRIPRACRPGCGTLCGAPSLRVRATSLRKARRAHV